MTRQEAWQRLVRLFGEKRAGYRVAKAISSPEKRQKAKEAADALHARWTDVKTRREARAKELLSDSLYQELEAESRALYRARDQALAEAGAYRFTIGTSDGMFFHVSAQGDTWEECFAKLDATQQKAKAS